MENAASQDPGAVAEYQPRVGDLVRVALRHDRGCEDCPHFPGESRRVGRVVHARAPSFAPSHPFVVMFAAPCFIETRFSGRLTITAHLYAADELEPISD